MRSSARIATALAPLLLLSTIAASAVPLAPRFHGDFGHYTFALTWQPGICSTDGGCLRGQPHTPLIGLHGLWASRPRPLIARGIGNRIWWSEGCAYYGARSAPLRLQPQIRREVLAVMPRFRSPLLPHEYGKHVACFGFDPNAFFSTELAMRAAVVRSAFAHYLDAHAGSTVSVRSVRVAFDEGFATTDATSLQLECGRNPAGTTVLTQLWITIRANRLAQFPRASSLMDALTDQTTCPSRFAVPRWPH
jgi:ribonuclease I